MSRWATHFLLLGTKAYKMYCLELDAAGNLQQYFPLTEEIAGTSFVEGILLAVPALLAPTQEEIRHWLSSKFPDYSSLITFSQRKPCILPVWEKKSVYFKSDFIPSLRLNSAQTTAVAIATFNDSAVSLSGG